MIWNLRLLVTAWAAASQPSQKKTAILGISVKAQELAWLDLLLLTCNWVLSPDLTGKEILLGVQIKFCFMPAAEYTVKGDGPKVSCCFDCFCWAWHPVLKFLKSWLTEAHPPALGEEDKTWLSWKTDRKALSCLRVSSSPHLSSWDYCTKGFNAGRLDITFDFIQV